MPRRVSGSARVKAVTIATADGERRLPCDALLIDAPRAPAYELCAQAGAELSHEPRGFVVRTGAGGRVPTASSPSERSRVPRSSPRRSRDEARRDGGRRSAIERDNRP